MAIICVCLKPRRRPINQLDTNGIPEGGIMECWAMKSGIMISIVISDLSAIFLQNDLRSAYPNILA